MAWRKPGQRRAWVPPVGRDSSVGVGEGSFFDEILGGVQQRLSEIPDYRVSPISAIGNAASAVLFDAPYAAAQYVGGVAIGGEQALAQGLGVRPTDQPIDVRAAARGISLQPVHDTIRSITDRTGEGTPVTAALGLANEILPNDLETFYSYLDSPEKAKELPPVTDVGNIFMPRAATTRFDAATPEVLAQGVNLLAGGAAIGGAGAALKAGGAAITRAAGMTRLGEISSPVAALGRAVGIPDLPQGLEALSKSPMGQRVGAAARFGLPVGLAAEQGLTTPTEATGNQPAVEPGSSQYWMRAGERAAGGLLVGALGSAVGGAAFKMARAGAIQDITAINPTWSATTRQSAENSNAARTIASLDRVTRASYPGGTWGYFLMSFRQQASDALAAFKDIEALSAFRRGSGLAASESGEAIPATQAALGATKAEVASAKALLPPLREAEARAGLNHSASKTSLKQATEQLKTLESAKKKLTAAQTGSLDAQILQATQDKKAAEIAVKTADAAEKAAKAKHTEMRGAVFDKDRQRQIYERNLPRYQAAELLGMHDQPFHEDVGKLSQLLAGADGLTQRHIKNMYNEALTYQRDPVTKLERGLLPGNHKDFALFDDYMRAFGQYWSSFKGLKVDAGKKLVNGQLVDDIILDPADAKARLMRFIADRLGGDVETQRRYNRTMRAMTRQHNKLLDDLATPHPGQQPMLSPADVQKIKDTNWVYLRKSDLETVLSSMNESLPLSAQKLFATTRGVDFEKPVSAISEIGLQHNLDRDAMLIRLHQRNKVIAGWKAAAEADPLGVGHLFKKWFPHVQSKSVTAADLRGDIRGEQVRLNRQTKRLTRRVDPTTGQYAKAVDRAQTKLTYWVGKVGATTGGTQDAQHAMGRVQHFQKAFNDATQRLADAHTDLGTLTQKGEVVGESLARARKEAEDLAKASRKSATAEYGAVERGKALLPLWENGKVSLYETEDFLADLARGAGTPQGDMFTKVLNGAINSMWKAAVTTYSLSFVARNPLRDLQTAMINYGGATNPVQFLTRDYMPALLDVVSTTAKSLWGDALLAGAKKTGSKSATAWASNNLAEIEKALELTSQMRAFTRSGGAVSTLAESTGSVDALTVLGLVRRIAMISEMPARVAIFNAEKALGKSPQEAAYLGRTILTDFSKSGQAMRVANQWFPLLNARMQGQLQSWEALKEDPRKFAARLTSTVAIPYMLTYAWNRTFGDMLDMIPQSVQQRSVPIIYGKYFNDKTQREEPLYLKVPLTDVGAGVALPLRYALDDEYHTQNDSGQPLGPGQRSEWTPQGVFRTVLAGFMPSSPDPNEMDPLQLVKSVMLMNPAIAVAEGLGSNYDRFRDRPVADSNAAVLWDQYRFAPPDTSIMAQAATELMTNMGVNRGYFAPAQVDFALKTLGGSLMQPPVSLGADQLIRQFVYGNSPPPSERKLSAEQLKDAPASFIQYINQAQKPDVRPSEVKNIPWLFSAGGNGQSIIQKVKNEDPKRYEQWQQTLGLQDRMQEWNEATYKPALRELLARRDISHAKMNDEMIALAKEKRAVAEAARSEFPLAITDPAARRAFIAAVPGIPVSYDETGASMTLPGTPDIAAMSKRWLSPSSIPQGAFDALNPIEQQSYRDREIDTMARELEQQTGQTVDPHTIERTITAYQRGISLPALPLPETYVDEWVDRWRAPDGFSEGDPPEKLRLLRQLEIEKIAADYGIQKELENENALDPSQDAGKQAEQAVLEIINTRLTPIGEVVPLDVSRDRAYAVSANIRDPEQFPDFADREGNVVGSVDQQKQWMDLLLTMEQTGMAKDKWPAQLKVLDTARSYANVKKTNALFTDPDYLDYSRWFGVGRTMSADQWEQFTTGEQPKYKTPDGTAIDADTSVQLDYIAALYRALPMNAPEKKQLLPVVRKIRGLAVPAWLNYLDISDLQPESTRKLTDDITDLERELAGEQSTDVLEVA